MSEIERIAALQTRIEQVARQWIAAGGTLGFVSYRDVYDAAAEAVLGPRYRWVILEAITGECSVLITHFVAGRGITAVR